MDSARLTAEIELLLCCAQTSMREDARSKALAVLERPIDWRRLLSLAIEHRVSPLVHRSLTDLPSNLVPRGALNELALYCRRIARRNLLLAGRLAELVTHLSEAQIQVITYKGPPLALVAYGNISMRHFVDLDILVSGRDYVRARDLLIERGYRLVCDHGWECSLEHEAGRVCVDLHRDISPETFPSGLLFERHWERRHSVPVAGVQVATLSAEDLFITLCVQLCKDAWERHPVLLSKVCDIAELIRAESTMDLDEIASEAERRGCRRMVWIGTEVAHRLIGMPTSAIKILSPPQPPLEPLIAHVCGRLLDDAAPGAFRVLSSAHFQFRLRERWWDKGRAWYHGTWIPQTLRHLTPSASDRAVIDLPAYLNFLYYLLRPIRFARDVVRAKLEGRPRH